MIVRVIEETKMKRSTNTFKLLSIIVLSGAVLTSAGCSSTPSPVPTATIIPPVKKINGVPTLPIVVNNGRGDYLQSTILGSDPAMKYNPKIVDEQATALADSKNLDLSSMQTLVVKFVAEEGLDSTLNGGGDVNAWWENHKDVIAPESQESILTKLRNTDGTNTLVATGAPRVGKYDFTYGKDNTRISHRSIDVNSIKVSATNPKEFSISITATYAMNITQNNHDGVENDEASLNFTVRPGAVPNQWFITGYDNKYKTTLAAE
jgi:hypothetical protein